MKIEILDTLNEDNSICFLGKSTLKEYLTSLPTDYQEYIIQRELVKNTYLDQLVDTVLNKKHIPTIVLITQKGNYNKENIDLTIDEFKILDGLQRTFRLKTIWDTVNFLINEFKIDNEILSKTRYKISRDYSERLKDIDSTPKILFSIIKHFKSQFNDTPVSELINCFEKVQWFEIWTNLSIEDQVNKMLVLNAGHKPVKTKHQLELVFMHLLPVISQIGVPGLKLVREKDIDSNNYHKNREVGQFLFSHIITSILSFFEAKPLTANIDLVQKHQNQYSEYDENDSYFDFNFLETFLKFLIDLDRKISDSYPNGTKWLSREVLLVGISAALGKLANEHEITFDKVFETLKNKLIDNPTALNLDDFENERNSLDLGKINIGNANKNAIYAALSDLLNGDIQTIVWHEYFVRQSV